MAPLRYDLVIIGAGPAGYEAAAHAAASGSRVLLVERDLAGGTCLNRGCIPTKALCRSAEVMAAVEEAARFGIAASAPTVDFPAVVARKEEVVSQLRQGVDSLLAKVDRVHGTASLRHPVEADALPPECARVVVTVAGNEPLEACAPKVMIATGSRPSVLPIEGAELCADSTAMLSLNALPESLCIIGGGVIGMEFASIFNAFGVKVSVVEYCKEILPPFDRDIAKRLRTALKQRGIDFHLQAEVKSVEQSGNLLKVNFESKGRPESIEAHTVLMATGRTAVVPDGCAECGIAVGRRGIEVDARTYATSLPGVYAVGDCNGICQLAHAATAQALSVLGVEQNCSVVPSAVFTMPECAMVGLTEEQCKESGTQYVAGKAFYRANGKALAMGAPDGLVKTLVDPATGRLLGVHILGEHASDLIAEAALAIANGLPASAILRTIHTHPSLAEILPPSLPR